MSVIEDWRKSMSSLKDFEFEHLEKYHGGAREVRSKMNDCPKCGTKMNVSHRTDSVNLLLQETSRCLECDFGQRKVIHIVN